MPRIAVARVDIQQVGVRDDRRFALAEPAMGHEPVAADGAAPMEGARRGCGHLISAELAPFLAQARTGLEAATDGPQPQEAIEHLQSTLARTEIEASRLGIRFDRGLLDADADIDAVSQADGLGPVVVIRRLVEDSET